MDVKITEDSRIRGTNPTFIIEDDIENYMSLESAVNNNISNVSNIIIDGGKASIHAMMAEQLSFANQFKIEKHNIEYLLNLDIDKENHPHGWYRKFEKKRF